MTVTHFSQVSRLALAVRCESKSNDHIGTYFRIGVVAGSRAAVVLELAVTDAKRVGGVFRVNAPGVVHLVPDQAWQPVGRAR